MVCGRRWGKTALGLQAAIRGHGAERGQRKGAIDGGKIWWVAPDYPTAEDIWRDLQTACRGGWKRKDETERRIELTNGGSITVKSANSALVGAGLDGVILDEAATYKEETWTRNLRPTLSDRNGWAIFISTPRGHNWFYDLYSAVPERSDWSRWQRPTSDNPLIPPEEIEQARRDSPRFFGQEYLAQFTQAEGAEWPPEYFRDSIWAKPGEWPGAFAATALAIDPASAAGEKKKGCYVAMVFVGLEMVAMPQPARLSGLSGAKLGQPIGRLWVDCWMDQTWDASRLCSEAVGIGLTMGPQAVSVETNGGQSFLAPLLLMQAQANGYHMPLFGINNSTLKEARIRTLGPFLSRDMIKFRVSKGCQSLVNQLRDFPVGEFVDGPDALEMGLNMIQTLLGQRKGTGAAHLLRT